MGPLGSSGASRDPLATIALPPITHASARATFLAHPAHLVRLTEMAGADGDLTVSASFCSGDQAGPLRHHLSIPGVLLVEFGLRWRRPVRLS
jgi:hypothetical protein